MDKPTDSRGHSSADNKKSNQNPHLSDEQLLLALDGELSKYESELVQVHLEACWSCRARSEQIEEAICDVVRHRDLLRKSFLPLSADRRAMFVVQLQQFVRTVGRPSLGSRVLAVLRALRAFLQGVIPRYVWISGLVMATLTLLMFTRSWEVPKVSASQVLENAQVSEVRAFRSVAKPVVYQRLSIRIGSQAVTRTIYRDLGGMRQADHLNLSGSGVEIPDSGGSPDQRKNRQQSRHSAKDEIQQTFLAARLNWQDPLSPTSYRNWRNNLSEKQDHVSLVGNNLTITTTTAEGPITEARLTVRTSDFHPIAENLRLQDTRQVEVNELAWEVLPIEAINPAIFAPEPVLPPEVAHPANPAPPPPWPTDVELTESELRARVAIHAERADLGEQIELDRDTPRSVPSSGQRSVVVRGIVSTPERKDGLLAAFRGIPHLELRLQTVQEAATQQNRVTADNSQGKEPQTPAVVIAGRPALEQQLEELFPIDEDRAAFVNRAVELVQDAMAQAWALRRLRDSYSPDIVAKLSRRSQQTLELLIRDHVSALRQHVDEARNLVSPLVPSESIAQQVPRQDMLDPPLPGAAPESDWRSAVTEIFPEIQRVNENVAALFAGSGETASETQAVVRDLQLDLAKLQTQLPMLYQNVNGPFLSEPKNNDK
jgi:hypothetical protein